MAAERLTATNKRGGKKEIKPPKRRVHVALPASVYDLLSEAQRINGGNMNDTLKDALLTYDTLHREYRNGKDVYTRDPNTGGKTSFELFFRR